MTQWAIQESSWGSYTAFKIERETEHCVFVIRLAYNARKLRRLDKHSFLDWRGDEAIAAMALVEKLRSARLEYDRQKAGVTSRFIACKAELIAEATKP